MTLVPAAGLLRLAQTLKTGGHGELGFVQK